MGKLPSAGRVKTRLCPPLSHEQAAAVHGAFLRSTLEQLLFASQSGGVDRVVWCFDPPDQHEAVEAFLRKGEFPAKLDLLPQSAGDLGDRLIAAAKQIEGPVLFLGCDSPDLPDGHLEAAVERLRTGAPIVLGPCDDGGFWCLGVGKRVDLQRVLTEIDWSSGRELRQVHERAMASGYQVADAPGWRDVDRAADLANLWFTLPDSPVGRRLGRDLSHALPIELLKEFAKTGPL